MKALCLTGYGRNIRNKLQYIEIERPRISPNDVLIKVYYSGLNPVDYKLIHGAARLIHNPPLPYPLGFDLSGIIVEVGAEVKDFNIGDEVYSKVPWDQMGTLTEYVAVREDMVALKPSIISLELAAGLPLVGCTVLDAFDIAKIKKNDKVLIHAGSGGVGTFAIQYAKYLGAFVYTTTSTDNVNWVKELGADRVIDYNNENYLEIATNLDFVLDTLGGAFARKATRIVNKGGTILSIAGHLDNQTLRDIGVPRILLPFNYLKGSILTLQMKRKKILYKFVFSQPNGKKLNTISRLVELEEIVPVTNRIYEFQDAIDGFIFIKSGRAKGKVVVKIT